MVAGLTAALAALVAKAGDTMTGDLTIDKANATLTLTSVTGGGSAVMRMAKSSSGSTVNAFNFYRGTIGASTIRWQIIPGSSASESGSNAGTNFEINRFSDNGTALGTVMSIARNTGLVSFGSSVSSSGSMTAGTGITASSGNISATGGGSLVSTDGSTYTTTINSSGLTNTGQNVSGSTNFRNIIDINPAGFNLILSGQHVPGVSAAWQFQLIGAASFTFLNDGKGYCTQWVDTSDVRLKENFEPLTNVLARMKKARAYSFNWKGGHVGMAGPQIPKRHLGGKAQEFELVFPEIVDTVHSEELPDKRMMAAGGMGVVAYAGALELLERLEAAERRITQLEARA